MARLGGQAGAAAAFAMTAGLAFDGGGFHAAAVDRALVAVLAAALIVAVLVSGARPGRLAAVLLGALGLLLVWTLASWLWSDSPPIALQEAQRAALYLSVAAAVVLAGRRVPPEWLGGGVLGGATVAGLWNLAVRLAPDWAGRGRCVPTSGSSPIRSGTRTALRCSPRSEWCSRSVSTVSPRLHSCRSPR